MSFNSQTFQSICQNRGLSIDDLHSVTKISQSTLSSVLNGGKTPTKNQVFKLADLLAVPAYAFFVTEYTVESPTIIDFRSKNPHPLKFGRNTPHFTRILQLRDFLAELYVRLDFDAPQKLLSEQKDENPEQFAAAISQELNLNDIRKTSKDKKDFFRKFRDAVESLGVYTVQNHYFSHDIDGFAIYHESFSSNLIYINSSKRNHGAKSFTLAHELSHILGRRSAISNNYQSDNDIEKYCNAFAVALLLPRNEVVDFIDKKRLKFDNYEIAIESSDNISRQFKCSVSASLLRAIELGYAPRTFYLIFSQNFGSPGFLDTIKPRGGGANEEGPEPGIVDLAMFGKRVVGIINESLIKNVTDHYEIFKKTGLSRKRIDGLLHIAKEQELSA